MRAPAGSRRGLVFRLRRSTTGSRLSEPPARATYAAKGFVERLLESGARVAIVDPLGVWGLRASCDGSAPGYPVVVFGGRHADIPITADAAAILGQVIAREALVCVVDLSELGSSAARRRFMAAFAEALYEANEEQLHIVLDEADLWAPQRPIKGWEGLLGHIEEIVRRGRVRGFIPWLITQRPAVVHKDVLSQADILVAMKLTASQDRDAIGAWIESQADRQEGKPRQWASTRVYPTTIFPTIGRRNAVLMFLMGLGLILAIGWFINGISIEPANVIDQQVRYLSYVISAAGWIIFTLSLFLGIMISQLDVIADELRKLSAVSAEELRQLSAVSAEPAPSQPVQSP